MVEMVVVKLIVRMVVAESHDEERKKRETMVEKKLRGKTDFLSTLAFDFSFLKP
jgi:hypothetical protein